MAAKPYRKIRIMHTDTATLNRPAPPDALRPARWPVNDIIGLYELPFQDLLYQAQTVHRQHHTPNTVQLSSLLSIKTGGCPEDCAYCPQSARDRKSTRRTTVTNAPL